MVKEYRLNAPAGGRYLVRPAGGGAPSPLLVGFHGWGLRAEDELRLLRSIPGSGGWSCCAVEGLYPVTRRDGEEGRSWMAPSERERRIRENVGYVDGVIEAVLGSFPHDGRLVLHGFSQGAQMAVRSALLGRHGVSAVMMVGGDIPPESTGLSGMGRVHIARGTRDPLYREELHLQDLRRLGADGVDAEGLVFSGAHHPEAVYLEGAGAFLRGVLSRSAL
ncbi:phospholipase [Chlorobium sp. N1]|uniref:alpha/beta hydrolase n=1 Tax=Chlorobium sp. N1 TaxID=2491138 RepID=UPI00104089EE|nr:phospholipase [Chlorobium sp. N1]TCD48097.1 phospholipase [Chlorobium sp. N1]